MVTEASTGRAIVTFVRSWASARNGAAAANATSIAPARASDLSCFQFIKLLPASCHLRDVRLGLVFPPSAASRAGADLRKPAQDAPFDETNSGRQHKHQRHDQNYSNPDTVD